jgi:hypothetical protein
MTVADFRTRFPEFSDVATYPDAIIQQNIDDATLEVGSAFGTFEDVALAYLSAHFLVTSTETTSGDYGSKGGVASEAVDGVSVSYSNAAVESQSDQYLISTIYGQRFLRYKRRLSKGNVRVV